MHLHPLQSKNVAQALALAHTGTTHTMLLAAALLFDAVISGSGVRRWPRSRNGAEKPHSVHMKVPIMTCRVLAADKKVLCTLIQP